MVEPPPAGLDMCAALVEYDEAGRELVLALKYRNHRQALPFLGHALARLATDACSATALGQPGLVTWAPTSSARRRGRGFDQAHLLARATATALGLPAVSVLRRVGGAPQTGAPVEKRLRGPRFVVCASAPVIAGPVVVVDDVVTTGATLSAAARALRDAGFGPVAGVVVARTELKIGACRADERN
ncbi:MAG: phosphoribosyltransferase family protein [Acidimicrobiales bacterium]|nr:phosphoribosyltransferase family protein [Acidimicrobiales bacterium]